MTNPFGQRRLRVNPARSSGAAPCSTWPPPFLSASSGGPDHRIMAPLGARLPAGSGSRPGRIPIDLTRLHDLIGMGRCDVDGDSEVPQFDDRPVLHFGAGGHRLGAHPNAAE